jgi:hypothetical protein
MDTPDRVRRGAAVLVALAALVLGALGCSVVYGFSAEYSGGTGLQVLPVVVAVPALVAAVAVALWPGSSGRAIVLVPVGSIVLLLAAGLGADLLGDRAHGQRLLEESRSFACNGPNAEIRVDPRVDEVFAELPRRAPIYGPVGGSPTGCTAGVSGPGAQSFEEYAAAFRDLDGWTVTADTDRHLEMERDGVQVSLRLAGAPDRLTTLEVSVGDPGPGRVRP